MNNEVVKFNGKEYTFTGIPAMYMSLCASGAIYGMVIGGAIGTVVGTTAAVTSPPIIMAGAGSGQARAKTIRL